MLRWQRKLRPRLQSTGSTEHRWENGRSVLVRHALAPKVEEVVALVVEVVGPMVVVVEVVEVVEVVGLVEEVEGAVDTKPPVPCELRPL